MIPMDSDPFEDADEADRLFEIHVPYGDEALMVLKAHLIIEQRLIAFINSRVPPQFAKNAIEDGNSPCRSGLGLILLAEGISLHDEVPQVHASIIWPALKLLNGLRNQLAHELEPDSNKIRSRISKFIEQVAEEVVYKERNINQQFRDCVCYVHALIAIDRCPLSYDDLEGESCRM